MSVHAVTVDWSPDTGSLVVCTCGLVLGPFNDYDEAKKEAREHRRWTGGELVFSDDRATELRHERERRYSEERKARRDA